MDDDIVDLSKYEGTDRIDEKDDTPKGQSFAPSKGAKPDRFDEDAALDNLFPGENFSGDDDDEDDEEDNPYRHLYDDEAEEPVETTEVPEAPETKTGDSAPKAEEQPVLDPPKAPQPEALKEFFPDADDDADLVSLAADRLKSVTADLDAERTASAKLAEIFEETPEMAQLARSLGSGKGFLEALASVVDLEQIVPDPAQDPDGYRAYVRGQTERQAEDRRRQEESQKRSDQIAANQTQTKKTVESFIEQKNLSKDDWKSMGEQIDGFVSDAVEGKFSPQFLDLIHKGLNYEKAVSEARQQGEIAGKNAAAQNIQKRKAGDGLPSPQRRAASVVRTPQQADPIREAIGQAVAASSDRFAP